VGKSVLFKPLNIQTAFTFSGALFVGKTSFFCFSGVKLFHGLRSPPGRGILLSRRQGLTWCSRRTRKSGAPLNSSVRVWRSLGKRKLLAQGLAGVRCCWTDVE